MFSKASKEMGKSNTIFLPSLQLFSKKKKATINAILLLLSTIIKVQIENLDLHLEFENGWISIHITSIQF